MDKKSTELTIGVMLFLPGLIGLLTITSVQHRLLALLCFVSAIAGIVLILLGGKNSKKN